MIIPNIWKNKSHVPNHQPVLIYLIGVGRKKHTTGIPENPSR
jgi:hypothetical protein